MADEVVMKGSEFSAPNASVAVGTLAMSGIVEAFTECAPLQGKVIVVVE